MIQRLRSRHGVLRRRGWEGQKERGVPEMSTQYDQIADLYAAISDATILIRVHVEQPTFLKVLGSIAGQSIVDVA
jgi:hypothetical protein